MAERVVSWTAVANFASANRAAKNLERDLESLRKKQAQINAQNSSANKIAKGTVTGLASIAREARKTETALDSLLKKQSESNSAVATANKSARNSAASATQAQIKRTQELTEANIALLRAQREQIEAARMQERVTRDTARGLESVATSAKRLSRETQSSVNRDFTRNIQSAGSASRGTANSLRSLASEARGASRNLTDAERSATQYGRRTTELGNSARRARGDIDSMGTAVSKAKKPIDTTTISFFGMSRALRAMKWPLIITGVNILTAAVSPLTAGMFGLIGALGPVTGLLATLPGLTAAAAGGIGVLVAGFAGIGGALKEFSTQQKDATKNAGTAAKAQQTAAKQAQTAARSARDAAQRVMRAERDAAEAAVQSARTIRDAKEGVKDAQEQAAESAERSARAIASANRSLRDAQEAQADAAIQASRSIQSAERNLGESQIRAIAAQKGISDARREAKQQIDDLRQSIKDLALEEEGASLTVEEARKRLQRTLDDPASTDLERRQADLAVREAEAALGGVQKAAKEADKKSKDANKKGVEGSDAVVEAKEAEKKANLEVLDAQRELADSQKDAARSTRDAARAVLDAQQGISDAQKNAKKDARDSARGVRDAQRTLTDAYDNAKRSARDNAEAVAEAKEKVDDLSTAITADAIPAVDKFKEAMAKLTPEARAVVNQLIKMKPLLDTLRATAQKGMLPGVLSFLKDSVALFPYVNLFVGKAAKSFGDFFASLGDSLTTDTALKRWGDVLDSTNRVIDDFLEAGGNIAGVIGDIITAGSGEGGLTEWLSGTIKGWTESWKAMTEGEDGQKRMRDFFLEVRDAASRVGSIIKNVAGGIFGMAKGTKQLGENLLAKLDGVVRKWNDWANSGEGQNWLADWATKSEETLSLLGGLIGDLFKGFKDISEKIDLNAIIKQMRDQLVPALVSLASIFTGQLASDIISIVSNVATFISAFGPEGAGIIGTFASALETLTGFMADISKHKAVVGIISGLVAAMVVKKGATLLGSLTGVSGLINAAATTSARGGGLGGAQSARGARPGRVKRAAGFTASTVATAAGIPGGTRFTPDRSKTDAKNKERNEAPKRAKQEAKARVKEETKQESRAQSTGARRSVTPGGVIPSVAQRSAGTSARTNPLAALFSKATGKTPAATPAPRRATPVGGATPGINPSVGAKASTGGKGVGKNVTDGMTTGLNGKGATTKITTIAQSIITAAKKTLGIKSPSTKFMEIGRMIAQGIIKGMQQMAGPVTTAATALSAGAVAGGKAGAAGGAVGKGGKGKNLKNAPKASKNGKASPAAKTPKAAPGMAADGGTSKLAGGAMKAGGAIGTLALLLSFLPGPIGEVASKASMLIFVLSLLAPVFGKIFGWLGKLGGPLKSLGGLFLKFGGVIKAVITLVGGQMLKLVGIVAKALMIIGRAMLANPWVLLITALVIIVLLVIKYWDQIKAVVLKAVGFLLTWLKANWQTLIKIILGPLGFLIVAVVKNWDKIKAALLGAISRTLTAASKAWDFIKKYLIDPFIITFKVIKEKFDKFKTAITTAFTNQIERWRKIFAKIKEYLTAPFDVAKDVGGFLSDMKTKVDEWVGKIGGAWDKLKAMALAPIEFIVDTVLNGGLLKAYNTVAKILNLDTIPDIKLGKTAPSKSTTGGSGGGRNTISANASGGYAGGSSRGVLRGPGTGTSDSILGVDRSGMPVARVSRGEFVVKESVTKKNRGFLESFNAGKVDVDGFAYGGFMGGTRPHPNAEPSSHGANYYGAKWAGDFGSGYGGQPAVEAWKDGIVASIKRQNDSYGNHITINHNDGQSSLYAHLNRIAVGVRDQVRAGQTIGNAGWTGNVNPKGPGGAHLHFEIRGGQAAFGAGQADKGDSGLSNGASPQGPSMLQRLIDAASAPLKKLSDKALDSPMGKMAAAVPTKLFGMMKQKVTKSGGASATDSGGSPGGSAGAPGGAVGKGREAAKAAGLRLGASSVGTYPGHQPSMNKAWDFMSQGATGQRIADHLAANRKQYGISYLIWNRQMLRDYSKGDIKAGTWAPYFDGGSSNPNRAHTNHVHASFYARGTRNAKRGPAVVGENGPELLYMKGGEKVDNAQKTKKKILMDGPKAGLPGYHLGGTVGAAKSLKPIRGFQTGKAGNFVRALRSQLFMGESPKWDKTLDARLKKGTPGVAKAVNPSAAWIKRIVSLIQKSSSGYTSVETLAKKAKTDPAYLWRAGAKISAALSKAGSSLAGKVSKKKGEKDSAYKARVAKAASDKRAKFGAARGKYSSTRGGWVKSLESMLGLKKDGIWGSEITAPLKHVLDHNYKRVHSDTDTQPWLGVGNDVIQEQKRTNALNAEFDKLNTLFTSWKLDSLVRKNNDLGPADALTVMRNLSKSKTAATTYDGLLKKEYARSDAVDNPDPTKAQIDLFLKTINSGSRVGLQQASAAASVSLDAGASLFDKITREKLWGSTPETKKVRVTKDVADLRNLFKFARGGTVPGSGSGDKVQALLEPREFVLRKKAASAIESQFGSGSLDYLNNMDRYANGGFVAGGISMPNPTSVGSAMASRSANGVNGGAGNVVNYNFNTEVNNPVAEKSSVSVQKRVTRVARLGLLAEESK